jgi:beta-glucosidase/6-phospho-beta-glucosidase/beta-galactosidase
MKKKILVLVLLLVSASSFILAESVLDFRLNNKIGCSINNVYVSPAGEDNWSDDILSADILANGKSIDISFDGDFDSDSWDLYATDEDGDEYLYQNLDLTEISELTLKWSASRGGWAEWK